MLMSPFLEMSLEGTSTPIAIHSTNLTFEFLHSNQAKIQVTNIYFCWGGEYEMFPVACSILSYTIPCESCSAVVNHIQQLHPEVLTIWSKSIPRKIRTNMHILHSYKSDRVAVD